MIHSKILNNIPGIQHGFGTRFDAAPPNTHLLQQVHGKKVVVIRRGDEAPVIESKGDSPKADAWVTNDPSLIIGIKTADCVPILLYDPVQKGVAAVHAGWKGSLANISGEVVKIMQEEFYSKPSDLVAAIGPAVGFHCYEVGSDVADHFKKEFGEDRQVLQKFGRKFLLDTQAVNRRQLHEAGLLPEKIEILSYCTHCRSDLLHSVRRDGDEAGRQVSWVELLG
ncbi:MAG: peptidoglycan editing factor PgeF [Deltaproteobacteria bacterium]|nr:peptidoglycan editing factor PgeF [Deltaproteobacteria bacterium]